jgi:signal transduction histidine kinase/CheY-like chemotaxis protein
MSDKDISHQTDLDDQISILKEELNATKDLLNKKDNDLEYAKSEIANYKKGLKGNDRSVKEKRLIRSMRLAKTVWWEWIIPLDILVVHSADQSDCILGYNFDDLEQSSKFWFSRLYPEDHERVEKSLNNCLIGKTNDWFSEHRYAKPSMNGFVWVSESGVVIERDENGLPIKMIGTTQNIDQRKKDELYLQRTKLIAEETANKKSTFLSNMSHELRTPLNGILGFTDMLSEANLNDENKDLVMMINECTSSLLVVVNDILDISKLNENMVQLEKIPFSLNSTILEITKMFQLNPQVIDRELKFSLSTSEIEQLVVGDKFRLRQVIVNLLNNAVKYTRTGFIHLKLKTDTIEKGFTNITLEVEDSGIGIPTNRLLAIFEKYTQSDVSDTRKYGGTGLGLAICNNIINLMGGDISVKSKEGIGSTFTIKLKLETHSKLTVNKREDVVNITDSFGKILLAEDNLMNQKLMAKMLKGLGDVDIVSDGLSAVKAVNIKDYDLILMDLQMPIMGGVDATKEIRKTNKNTPIVAITANVLGAISDECMEAGCDGFLTKPLKKKILVELLNNIFQK